MHNNEKNKPLVIPLVGVTGVKLTGTTIKENLTDSNVQYKTIKHIYNRFKPDGVFTFMDLTVEAESLGLEINFPENDTPSVREHSVRDKVALKKMIANYKGISGRMEVFIDTVRKMAENIPVKKGAYVIGPFSLAGELCGVNNLLLNTIMYPEFTHDVIDFSIDVISDYTKKLFDAGADTVCVLEPTAMMLSAEQYTEFSRMPFQKLLKYVGHKPLILHICGNTTHLIPEMCKSGACALSLDSVVDLQEIIQQIPPDIELIGNLDPVNIFLNGDKKLITKATKKLKEEMKGYPNFVLSSGCDLPLETPIENIDIFMQTD